jgi:predicted O-methyltransferase YrrM
MSLLRAAVKLMPIPARNAALRWREERRLGRLPAAPCDASPLVALDPAGLQRALSDPALGAEWPGVAAEIDRFRITTTAGGVNPGDRRALYCLIRSFRPARVLEVGTHIGASTVHIAAALRANAAAGGLASELTTVDILDVNDAATRPWLQYGSPLAPAEMIGRMGMTGRVRFVARPSLDFLADAGPSYDFIFLDGDHGAATVYRELPAALRRLAPGGVVLLHDYFPGGRPLWPGDPVIPGPWLGVERLRREGARLNVLPLGELGWPTKLGRNVTSLAAVVRASGG